MEEQTSRQRGRSFHEEFENKPVESNVPKGDNEGVVDGNEASSSEPQPRVPEAGQSQPQTESNNRIRSSSFNENESVEQNAKGGVGSVQTSQRVATSSSSSSTEGSRERSDRSSQLNPREVKALKMGLEQATAKNRTQQKEEEEEKRAAELEKKKRAAVSSPVGPGAGPPLRRYKLLLLGDSGVGKSSLICRWTLDTFSATLLGTVGVDFKAKKVSIESESFHIQVWDTAGQEQFHKITTSYYKGANGIMLVYDVTDEKSASEVSYWMKNIKSHAADDIAVVMVANKADLLEGKKESTILNTGKKNAKKYEIDHYLCSAKDSSGVDDAFVNLVKLIVAADDKAAAGKSTLSPHTSSGPKLAPGITTEKTSTLSGMFRSKSKSDPSQTPNEGSRVPGQGSTGIGGNGGKGEKCSIS